MAVEMNDAMDKEEGQYNMYGSDSKRLKYVKALANMINVRERIGLAKHGFILSYFFLLQY